jgi:hypothetical protein
MPNKSSRSSLGVPFTLDCSGSNHLRGNHPSSTNVSCPLCRPDEDDLSWSCWNGISHGRRLSMSHNELLRNGAIDVDTY